MKVREVFLLKEAVSDIEEGRIFYDKKEKRNPSWIREKLGNRKS